MSMRLRNEELMQEFYDRVSVDYPHLSIKEMTDICHQQFHYTKECIEGDEITRVRLKYLGCFQVYKGRAKYYLHKIKKQLGFGSITQETHDRFSGMIKRYLERIGES